MSQILLAAGLQLGWLVASSSARRPNVLIIQPDDLPHYDPWHRPPNTPNDPDRRIPFPSADGLPNLERLRNGGVELTQAYTTSAMCGTSRWSTITGRYPSRARSNEGDYVVIPRTKLEGRDCTAENIPRLFRDNGYRTSMFGKWHLSTIDYSKYTYEYAKSLVEECGFDHVSGLYAENLWHDFNDGSFSHNMEWITHEAIQEMKRDSDEPWFMYYNPTVPHGAESVSRALTEFSCMATPSGTLDSKPSVPGLTDGQSCWDYRQTIFERADSDEDVDLGAIWLDDAIGGLLRVLEDTGQLEDTVILFFEDHGMEPKSSLYEGGVRIPMFINYGSKLETGSKLDVPVSTVDIGPTLLEYADITPSYEMDGKSLKTAMARISYSNSNPTWIERCLFFELNYDRAVRCGCYKYLQINDRDNSNTWEKGGKAGLSKRRRNLFDLCNGTTEYSPTTDTEAVSIDDERAANELDSMLTCHSNQVESQDYGSVYDCQLPISSQARPLPEPSHDDKLEQSQENVEVEGDEVASASEPSLIVEAATVSTDAGEQGAPGQDSEWTAGPSSPAAAPSDAPTAEEGAPGQDSKWTAEPSSPAAAPSEAPAAEEGAPDQDFEWTLVAVEGDEVASTGEPSLIVEAATVSTDVAEEGAPGQDSKWTAGPSSPAASSEAPASEEGAPGQDSKWTAEPSSPAAPTEAAPAAEEGAPGQDSEWTAEPSSPAAPSEAAPASEEGAPGQDSEWTAEPSSPAAAPSEAPIAEEGAPDQDFEWTLGPSPLSSPTAPSEATPVAEEGAPGHGSNLVPAISHSEEKDSTLPELGENGSATSNSFHHVSIITSCLFIASIHFYI